ncbi:YojF family protein [Paenibacillus sp. MMS20-IR301]|uniref:YojF family protein n=1 Tax=Paenibacillus sp. MMS20-IR301 TaxID=2895946 RepID=UPI0028ED7EE2|nr:YojF family protein [Paenibacillus sp. MMS20-IR301]WNS45288.1 YojF family protein [Paenibacillus sp. MMS20-IR301]
MQPIQPKDIQFQIERLAGEELFIHLELTTGAYANHIDSSRPPGSAFISNAVIRYSHGSISGNGPYRVGLKTEHGWIYAEGLTHVDENETERLILAGHDNQGKLIVALQLSRNPF